MTLLTINRAAFAAENNVEIFRQLTKDFYSVFNKEGVKVEGYYTAKKWILGAV